METFKLGKLAPSKRDSVKFSDFVTNLPTAPLIDTAPNYAYPMFGNDVWGDCVCADEGHSQQVVSGLLTGTVVTPTMAQIETWYETQNPTWSPISGQEGNGMDIQTFLEYLVVQKIIFGFAEIDYTNPALLQAAIYIGLSVKVGVQLQAAQRGQQFIDGLWDHVPGSPTVGGHDICFVGYNATTKRYSIISWGKLLECTQAFVDNCVDEAWFPVRPAHLLFPGFRNFDFAGFSAAVSAITNNKINIPIPMQTYKHFTMGESTGGGHTFAELTPTLRTMLDNARDAAGVPFVITSGYRNAAENQAAGGVPISAHLTGQAADIACTDQTRWAIIQGALKAGFTRLEGCPQHVHMDIANDIAHPSPWFGISVNE